MTATLTPSRTLLPVVLAADSFPTSPYTDPYPSSHPTTNERYVPFHLTFADFQAHLPPLGQLRPDVVAELQADERDEQSCPWQFHLLARENVPRGGNDKPDADADADADLNLSVACVFFADWVVAGGQETMSRMMQDTAIRWRDQGKFPGPLAGWRNEKYSVYASKRSSAFSQDPAVPFSNMAFALERSACAIFGLATFGVHLTAYEGHGSEMKIWVPKRSATKPTFPSMLDNTVAGGIPSGMTPLDAMVKECDEEASLPEDFVKARLRNVGVTTYFYITDDGYLQPEVEYIYDLPLPPQSSAEYIKPKPHDDEVESFALLSVPEVLESLYKGEFKPNCGLILVDFLVRHGIVTPETEPNYLEISWRMHRRLAVGVPM